MLFRGMWRDAGESAVPALMSATETQTQTLYKGQPSVGGVASVAAGVPGGEEGEEVVGGAETSRCKTSHSVK